MRLRWSPPRHHAEIAGYHVYRSAQSGHGYLPITDRPVAATEYIDRTVDHEYVVSDKYVAPGAPSGSGRPVFYAVTAVEHSGLESGLSREACAGNVDAVHRTFAVAAAEGSYNGRMWIALDGSATGLRYVWMRSRDGEGRGVVDLDLPPTGRSYWVWARVKGEQGAEFRFFQGGRSVGLSCPSLPGWTWKRCPAALDLGHPLGPGRSQFTVSSNLYGSALDSLAVTTDPDFNPDVSSRIAWPKQAAVDGVSATAVPPYTARVSWNRVAVATFRHFNLYCGHTADFAVNQAALVASPDVAGCWDWALRPGETVYYRVTWVDRGGRESPPSQAAKVSLPPLERDVVELAPGSRVEIRARCHGAYVVWIKLKEGPSVGQYIDLVMDRGPVMTWTCVFDGQGDEAWFTYDQWGRAPLTPGVHYLSIDNHTKHTIEKVLVTNDFSFRPKGHVNVLGGW